MQPFLIARVSSPKWYNNDFLGVFMAAHSEDFVELQLAPFWQCCRAWTWRTHAHTRTPLR